MLTLKLQRKSQHSLFEQLVALIKDKVDSAQLLPGDNLPSSRQLAAHLSISRTTVCRAYEELFALGYLESEQGSFTKVRKAESFNGANVNPLKTVINWGEQSSDTAKIIHQQVCDVYIKKSLESENSLIDFVSLAASTSISPIADFRKCMNYVLKSDGEQLLQYGESKGYLPLREHIAEHLRGYGIVTEPGNILLTNGSQQSIDLVLQLLLEKGDRVLVESPSYSMIMPLLNGNEVVIDDVEMSENGLELEQLEHRLIGRDEGINKPAKLLYTIPNFHNPTGISSSQEHRERLYQLCLKYKLPIVEDSFVDEMKYFGKTPLPIKALDTHGLVIYLGAFSKVIFSGIRIGWIVANKECIERLTSLKIAKSIVSNAVDQAAMERFCRKGYYQQHIKRAHALYRKRMKLALKMAKETFINEPFNFTTPRGGYLLFVSATDKAINEKKLVAAIRKSGVSVSAGNNCYANGSDYAHFRISIAMVDLEDIIDGFNKIKQAISGDIR